MTDPGLERRLESQLKLLVVAAVILSGLGFALIALGQLEAGLILVAIAVFGAADLRRYGRKEIERVQAGRPRELSDLLGEVRGRPTTALALVATLGAVYFSTEPHEMVEAYGVFREPVSAGEWYRVLTYGFVHLHVVHFFANAFGLFALVWVAQRFYGPYAVIGLFLFGVLVGGIAVLSFAARGAIGASAGLTAFGGALSAFGLRHRRILPKTLFRNLAFFLPVVFGITLYFDFQTKGVSGWAHAGGFVAGLVWGGIYPMRWLTEEFARTPPASERSA